MKPYTHFTLEEKINLEVLLRINKSVTEIARELGRNKSSVSREIRRYRNRKSGEYCAWYAYSTYHKHRKKCRPHYRIQPGTELFRFICEKLSEFWSPQLIAAVWNKEHPDDRIAFATIYRALKDGRLPGLSPNTHLRRRGKKKYANRSKYNTIQPEHTIHDRPAETQARLCFGDFEGDTLKGAHGKGCLVTFVDRKSRFLLCAISKDMRAESIYRATLRAFRGIHPRSITLDNGPEFAWFKKMEATLDTTVYFADPHSPWQRGSNENINGLLRFFFQKGYDFRSLSPAYLRKIVTLINRRPRFCLSLDSPDQVFCCT